MIKQEMCSTTISWDNEEGEILVRYVWTPRIDHWVGEAEIVSVRQYGEELKEMPGDDLHFIREYIEQNHESWTEND